MSTLRAKVIRLASTYAEGSEARRALLEVLAARPSRYQQMIAEVLGATKLDHRWVEAFMRLEHDTLDHLSRPAFARAVQEAAKAAEADGPSQSEALARSYGL